MPEKMVLNMPESPLPRSTWKRRLVRWTVLLVVVPYLVLLTLFGLFQRSFIYPGGQQAVIRPEDARLPAGQVHDIRIKTDDGLQLNGWLVLADSHAVQTTAALTDELQAGRYLVLYFPGNAGNRLNRAFDCREFAELQCDVVLVDYRGYGDNPGSPREELLAADALSVWKHLTEEYQVSAERILLFGESLGGGVATRLAEHLCTTGERPAGLILNSTFSSMTDTARWHYPFFPVRTILLDRYPSADRISSVTCPIVAIHGAEDRIVPIELGRRLFESAPMESASGIAKRFIEVPSAGHNSVPRRELRDAVEELLPQIESGER